MIKKLIIRLGFRDFRPIVSMYLGFNTRNIIYECTLTGERKAVKMYRPFGVAFPIDTNNFLSFKEFDAILGGADYVISENNTIYLDLEVATWLSGCKIYANKLG